MIMLFGFVSAVLNNWSKIYERPHYREMVLGKI